jgi:hypothetical protein
MSTAAFQSVSDRVRIGCLMMRDGGAFSQGPFGTAERRETSALGRTSFDWKPLV